MQQNTTILFLLATAVLSACQTLPSKQSSVAAQVPDPDIVTMPSLGKNAASGSGLLGVKPMTQEELTACAHHIVNIRQQSADLHTESTGLAGASRELETQNQALENERNSVKFNNSKQVNEFNKRVTRNRSEINAHNAAVTSYNDKANALNLLQNQYNTVCSSRAYRRSDYASLTPALKTAIESKSEFSDIPLIDGTNSDSAQSSSQFHIPAGTLKQPSKK
ncbi:hypothetical protein [Methylomonas rivi]|uniref:Lipoprotein n=1 Tax=Methylomonas rivi TaxID=2952226 RepID=A0ABT1U5U4_9GAMM|nr:hypothetical protein [Methylomonas sp. WSC-6]MCQ8128868.1 hypothetical protein [Methylomonas sp. WSC-6]